MNDTVRGAALGLLLLGAAGPAAAQYRPLEDPTDILVSGRTAETVILSWPTYSYRLARLMIEKYGQPAEIRDARLVWLDNGPWKRTVVHRRAGKDDGRLEQTVAYRVPPDKVDALSRYDKRVEVDAEKGRLTVRSDSESENHLALNLADEVATGRREPKEAAEFRKRVADLEDSGKSSSYLDGLMFVRPDEFANPESPD